MEGNIPAQRFDTVVIGGGQAGLSMGYYLKKQGRSFVILDAGERVGGAWRGRWDSLRLFSPAAFSALPSMPFPFAGGYFPTKDETADYLEEYAAKFDLPVRLGRRVDSLRREGDSHAASAGGERYSARNVVVATGSFRTPHVPDFAERLDPSITQIHSSAYRNPEQLPDGDVLVVGAGNSGAEISLDLAAGRKTHLSGRETGNVPISLSEPSLSGPALRGIAVGLWLVDRFLTVDTRLGRRLREYDRRYATPLVRASPRDLIEAGVERVPRVEGTADGKPLLADGRALDVASVVWATGYKPDFGWIELPIFGEDGYPIHYRGVVDAAPGLYFLGLPFQYTITSAFIGGVVKDTRYVADRLTPDIDAKNGGSHICMPSTSSAGR